MSEEIQELIDAARALLDAPAIRLCDDSPYLTGLANDLVAAINKVEAYYA